MDLTALPPSLAADIQNLEQRIAILERSNKLLASTIAGGTLRVLNDSGATVVQMGELDYGETGIWLLASNGTSSLLQVDQANGFAIPWISTEWTQSETVTVTSGTFATAWSTVTELLYAVQMLFRVTIFTEAGTTGELRIVRSSDSTQIGDTKTVPADTTAQYEFRISHGQTIGSGPHGFNLQARRTAGAGLFSVYHPRPMHYGSNMSPVSGGWV